MRLNRGDPQGMRCPRATATSSRIVTSCHRPVERGDRYGSNHSARVRDCWNEAGSWSREFLRKNHRGQERGPLRRNPQISDWSPLDRKSGTLRDRYQHLIPSPARNVPASHRDGTALAWDRPGSPATHLPSLHGSARPSEAPRHAAPRCFPPGAACRHRRR
jgi:hypothetical protein